ncbi:hypothetical protein DFJ43DRAFT_1041943 [Lentinula guzmanii]|uniref:Uncharacterized protein n=1 Tax=Lentinula guzmanii TaxID=2804957 RepID=A0AA38JAV4_9AGAR|nr:hypothetical protein DFJ43DRAFT_1044305 [Lentinula guzmanii]KAJ3723620.1 hypothetical protein DFJ43DRAFT_1041943 [Lentinula guzmanii]
MHSPPSTPYRRLITYSRRDRRLHSTSPLPTCETQPSRDSSSCKEVHREEKVVDKGLYTSDTTSLRDAPPVAGIEKQLAEALEELDAAKEKIGRYEAAVEEDLSCDSSVWTLHRRVDAMALEKGIPIPKRNPFKWPPAGTPKNHRSRIV